MTCVRGSNVCAFRGKKSCFIFHLKRRKGSHVNALVVFEALRLQILSLECGLIFISIFIDNKKKISCFLRFWIASPASQGSREPVGKSQYCPESEWKLWRQCVPSSHYSTAQWQSCEDVAKCLPPLSPCGVGCVVVDVFVTVPPIHDESLPSLPLNFIIALFCICILTSLNIFPFEFLSFLPHPLL